MQNYHKKGKKINSASSFLSTLGTKRPATSSSFSEQIGKKFNIHGESVGRTPKNRKTPNKSPGRIYKSPGRLDFTPGSNKGTPSRSDGADRFIPSRNAIDWDASKFYLQQRNGFLETNPSTTMSPQKMEYQRKMAQNLCGEIFLNVSF